MKEEKQSGSRDGKIEILRFAASLMIVNGHMVYTGATFSRPFSNAWYYVEFFLILTGYFTMRHFAVKTENPFVYTWEKFRRFLPFTVPAILCYYLYESLHYLAARDLTGLARNLLSLPLELSLLSAATPWGNHIFTLWFLSAMLVTLPLVCLIIRIPNRYIVGAIAIICPLVYYLHAYDYGSHVYPNQLIRTFCGLMLGVAVYFLTLAVRKVPKHPVWRVIWTVLLVVSYAVPLITGATNTTFLWGNLLCFIVCVTLTFSDVACLPKLSGPVPAYLGRLSMPVYIWQLIVAAVVLDLGKHFSLSAPVRLVLLLLGCIAVGVVNVALYDVLRHKLSRKKRAK